MKKVTNSFFVLSLLLLFNISFVHAKTVSQGYKGYKVLAEWVQASGKTADVPVVLILHGSIAHGRMEMLDATQTQLKEAGISSLAITLSLNESNRKGMFDCTHNHTHLHEDALNELAFWIKWLEKKGAKKIHLLGHSRGASQVLLYTSRHPKSFTGKVILYSFYTHNMKRREKSYNSRSKTPLQKILGQARKLVKAGKGSSLIGPVRFLHCASTKVAAKTFLNYYTNPAGKDTAGLLKKTGKPVLIAVGTKDNVVGAGLPAVKAMADGKRITVKMIDGAGHFFRDLYLEEVVEAVVKFIKPGK